MRGIYQIDADYCEVHHRLYATADGCPKCSPDVDRMRLTVQSRTIDVLQDEIARLRLHVAALQHDRIASQRAHNTLAEHVEQLEDAHNRLVVYAENQLREIEDRL